MCEPAARAEAAPCRAGLAKRTGQALPKSGAGLPLFAPVVLGALAICPRFRLIDCQMTRRKGVIPGGAGHDESEVQGPHEV